MNMKRMRGRNHRPNGGGTGGTSGGGFSRNQQNGIPLNRNHVFDSSGPEMRVRGTAQQLHEKYTQMARDASTGGDRVTGEAYYQHAEHYFRIISAINQAQGQPGQAPQQQPTQSQPQHYNQPNNGSNNSSNNGYGNGQNEYRRPAQHNGNGNGNTNGNGFGQELPEPTEAPRPYEPRQHTPRQDYQERRVERPREPAPEQRFDRIDISSALEAELEAAVAAPVSAVQQPARARVEPTQAVPVQSVPTPAVPVAAAVVEAPPVPRAIPIAATAPEETPADASPVLRRRGRPRLNKPATPE